MKTLLSDVRAFHQACDVPVITTPSIPALGRVALRIELIREEVNRELLPAMEDNDLIEIADAMADSIYVIVGSALEYGIPLDRVWNAVQAANMAKVDAQTGKVGKRADGKVLKPEGWRQPDIAAVLSSPGAEPQSVDQQGDLVNALRARIAELESERDTPETLNFMKGVPLEAVHQRARWGAPHDNGKTPYDWFWLIGYLVQKAADASVRGDTEKAKHHTISTAAALCNWHAALAGESNTMRPGIADPVEMSA